MHRGCLTNPDGHRVEATKRPRIGREAMGEYANDVLVSTDWLAENIDNPDVRIVEVDEDTEAYDRGHIRNALGVNWKSDLQDPLRRDFISGPDFEKLLA